MIKKKYNRHPNRFLNRVWIGLYANRIQGRPGRKVWKGAKGIIGLFGAQRKPQPLLNLLIAPPGAMVFTTGDAWTWEMPYQNPISAVYEN